MDDVSVPPEETPTVNKIYSHPVAKERYNRDKSQICLNCGEQGHWFRQCNFCNICKIKGHATVACPKRPETENNRWGRKRFNKKNNYQKSNKNKDSGDREHRSESKKVGKQKYDKKHVKNVNTAHDSDSEHSDENNFL